MGNPIDHKAVYGAGYRAGMKAAGAKVDIMAMTATRLKALVDQQSGIAKKVYDCVPVNEAFDAKRICSELARMGSAPDLHIVKGCLNTLKDAGLISELSGMFQRVKVRAEIEAVKCVAPLKQEPEGEHRGAATKDPLEMLAAAASHIRSLNKVLEGIAIEIEDAALQFDDQSAEKSQEVKKLRQLAELIKTL